MSIEHLNASLKANVKNWTSKYLLVVLSASTDGEGITSPTTETLADQTGMDQVTVRRHLTALHKTGWVETVGYRAIESRSIAILRVNIIITK